MIEFLCALDLYPEFFFFQAEDGIRDRNVTGVQTCALPISQPDNAPPSWVVRGGALSGWAVTSSAPLASCMRYAKRTSLSSNFPGIFAGTVCRCRDRKSVV